MRRLLFASLLLVAHGVAEEDGEKVVDKKSGLIIQVPSSWSRESAREKGSVKFAGLYDLTKTKYVIFTVETGPSAGYDEGAWLAREKEGATKAMKSIETAWSTEPVTVGGQRAIRYTIGGKANSDKDYSLRIRACAVVQGTSLVRISEASYNKAHDEAADAVRAMWDAVKFEEENPFASDEEEEGCGEGKGGEEEADAEAGGAKEGEGGMGVEAPKGEPLLLEDKAGNLKLTALPGWSMNRAPPEDADTSVRLILIRSQEAGGVGQLEVFRFRVNDANVFATVEPGDYLVDLAGRGFFEDYYEEGSRKVMRPEIDVRTRLGGADKSCGYEMRGIMLSEDAKIKEAEKLKARGQADVEIPEFKPIVVRGRVAMISPYVYVIRCVFARSQSDNAELVGEYQKMVDSFEFLTQEAKPPPLNTGSGPFGNTKADPANQSDRKKSKVHEYKKGTKVAAALKIDYVLPPGFQEAEKVADPIVGGIMNVGENVPLQIVAQDENNGWVWFAMVARSSKDLPANTQFEEKKKVFEGWVHAFESNARSAGRMPQKPQDVNFGNLSGDGCELKGNINNFAATEVHMVTDESGWRIEMFIKTRGTGAKTFAKEIETLRKKIRVSKK
jgi:hypothetical protein